MKHGLQTLPRCSLCHPCAGADIRTPCDSGDNVIELMLSQKSMGGTPSNDQENEAIAAVVEWALHKQLREGLAAAIPAAPPARAPRM